ncbi:MAG: hypothetical protein ACI93P_002373 [bacterium]
MINARGMRMAIYMKNNKDRITSNTTIKSNKVDYKGIIKTAVIQNLPSIIKAYQQSIFLKIGKEKETEDEH